MVVENKNSVDKIVVVEKVVDIVVVVEFLGKIDLDKDSFGRM